MANNDIIVSEMTPASQINTGDLMIMTQPDSQSETGYSTKSGTVLQVSNKMLKGTEYLTDLPDFTDKTVLGGLEELKGDLTALLPVDTASGEIANFDTDLSLPLVDCKANIVATGGNGTPENPNPINGYTEANITRCGVNLFDKTSAIVGLWQPDGTYNANNSYNTVYCRVKPNTTYTFSGTGNLDSLRLCQFNSLNPTTYTSRDAITASEHTFTTSADTVMLSISPTKTSLDASNSIQLAEGTDTTYHPYTGNAYTIAFGQTVYGCVIDANAGKAKITWVSKDLATEPAQKVSTNRWQYAFNDCYVVTTGSEVAHMTCEQYIMKNSNQFNYEVGTGYQIVNTHNFQFVNSVDGVKPEGLVIYELETPFDIDLTPEVISAVVGTNNVFADCGGDTSVKFKDTIQHYIDKKIAQTQALIL